MLDKNKYPLVSIIMNCFNGEFFLKESLESVINQTYKNWELIFWDNKSKDNSTAIFKSFDDKRFKYFLAGEHTSLYKARNLAIEKSKGDFIAFLDTDDIWNKSKIETQMPYFDNQEVGVVYSNLWFIKKNIKKKKIFSKKQLLSGKIHNQLLENYNVGILTVILRKNYFLKLKKKFDDRFSIIGDFDLFLRLSKICLFIGIKEPLAFYRLHGENLSTINKELEIKEFEIWLDENMNNLNDLQIKNFINHIDYRKFVNYKISGNYLKCINILFESKSNLFNIKSLIIFFTPVFFLKKFLWFHQD